MNNNDILRQTVIALSLDHSQIITIFKEAGFAMNPATLPLLLKREDEDGSIPCANQLLAFFLEGLIIHRRGRKDSGGELPPRPAADLNNNTVLKKLRIALDLKEEDMLAILKSAGMLVTKGDLAPLFHAKGHKRYKECSDTLLQKFLDGLTLRCGSRESR